LADIGMRLDSIVWDTVKDTATFTLVGDDVPPPPSWATDNWYAGPGTTVTMTVPVKKAATTQPTATYIEPDPTNPRKTIEWRYTWNGTAWGNRVRV